MCLYLRLSVYLSICLSIYLTAVNPQLESFHLVSFHCLIFKMSLLQSAAVDKKHVVLSFLYKLYKHSLQNTLLPVLSEYCGLTSLDAWFVLILLLARPRKVLRTAVGSLVTSYHFPLLFCAEWLSSLLLNLLLSGSCAEQFQILLNLKSSPKKSGRKETGHVA